ncbi:MAG: PAS domain S-box protein [Opitutaceae bacterium]|nr:PAS domain S-box protein [Opitutaceae bacterium]
MRDSAFIALIHNAALLLALVLVFDVATYRVPFNRSLVARLLVGLLLGGIGVGIMLAPFRFVSDIVFDTRSVLLAICGLYFGFVPTVIAVLLTAAFRLGMGGSAAWAGTGVIVASAALGLLWRRYHHHRLADLSWRPLFALGVAVHVAMLLILQLLGWRAGRAILLEIGAPVLVIYPVATMALGLLLTSRLRRERVAVALEASEARFAGFFASNPLPCVISDLESGVILDVNEAFVAASGRARLALVGRSSRELDLWAGVEERERILTAIKTGRNVHGLPVRWRTPEGALREALGFFEVWREDGAARLLSSFVDVTERNRIQATLAENEERLRLALSVANQGTFDLDLVTGECVVSPEYARMLGYDPADFHETAAAFQQRLHPEDRPRVQATLRQYLGGEVPDYRVEFRLRTRGGQWIWVLSVGRLLEREADGRPRRFLGTHTDITPRKESELAAAAAQAELKRLGLALDRLPLTCIYMKDRQGRYLYANRTTLELFGVTAEQLRGSDDTRFFPPATVLRLREIDRRVLEQGEETTEEIVVPLPDGRHRHYLEVKTPIYDEGPARRIVGICGISTDLTEHKETESALRASEQRYRHLFENEHTVMLLVDPATEAVVDANPAAASFYGWTRAELPGRAVRDLVPALAEPGLRPWAGGNYLQAPHRRADGTTREVEMFSGPMEVAGRKLVYLIVHDVTARREAEQRMVAAQAESARLLAEATQSRQSLLSLVEDLREADQRLKHEQELAQSTLDALQAHICVVDAAGVIIAVNRAWREFGLANGAPADAAWIGQNYLRVCGESAGPASGDGVEFALRLQAVLAGEAAALEMEYPCDSPTERRWFLARITRFSGQGAVRAVIAHENITARRLAEQAVRESEERWRSAVQGSAAGIWENDFINGTAFYSDRSKEILGYGPDDIPQRMETWVAMIHPDDVEIGRRAIAEHLAGRKPFYEAEHRFRCKDGSYKWIQSRGRASFDAHGKLVRVVGTHVDIHERKLAEERLRESSEFLDNLFNSANAPIAVWDPLFRITRFNRAFEQLTGRRADDVLGRDLPVLFPPDRVGELMALLRSTLAGEPWQGVEMPIQHVDGSVRLVLWNSATLFAADGRTPVATVVQGQDITERKQAETLLRTSLREKEALLKEVHHRVKNNLQVITSLLRLEVARNPESGTVGVLREMQGRIRSMALLHETLYRSGNLEQVDLAVYLERVAGQTFRAQNEGKPNVRLRLDLAWCPVSIDQAIPCGLIVNELVSNCLKHAFPARRGGEIVISLRPADPKGHVQITVADDGPGLPADFATRRQGSLGVQLVEDLARQLAGTLTVGQGAGATFTVMFPLAEGSRPDPGQS